MRPFVEAAIARAGSPPQTRAVAEFAAGSALTELGRYPEAMQHLERARTIWRVELDPHHPEAARTLLTIGNVLDYQGDRAGAEAAYRDVIRMRETSLGRHHPTLAGPLSNLGGQLIERGEATEALAMCARALELVDPAAVNATSPRGNLYRCIGRAYHHLDQVDQARAAYDQALATFAGAPNARAAYVLADLGELAAYRGDFAEALDLCERSLAAFRGNGKTEHPDHSYAYACRGRAHLELGHLAAARTDLDLAIEHGAATTSPLRRGELRFALARLGDDRATGVARRTLAMQARDDFEAAGMPKRAAAVEAWLGARTQN